MGRPRREWLTGSIYHLFSRGSNRQVIFVDEGDFAEFAFLLGDSARKYEIECFAWSLLPNHWHLLVRSPEPGLSRFVRHLNHRYSFRFNRRNERTAHLFANRFGAVLQETEEQFLWTLRYVLRNPVEAGISATAKEARWTSYGQMVGRGAPADFLLVEEVLARFGDSTEHRLRCFDAFLDS